MKNFLNKLKEHFANDDGVQDAVRLIELKLKQSPLSKPGSSDRESDTEFPLPQQLEEGNLFLFTDGACRGNPGPGAWGAMAQDHNGEVVFEASHFNEHTTNNIMELTAVLAGLEQIEEDFSNSSEMSIHVYSDSKYVVEGMKSWVEAWKRRGWKKADNKAPNNVEIWQALYEIKSNFADVKFYWVKGHSGHPQNERVDRLANIALDSAGF